MMGERITIARITGEGIGERDLSLSHDDVKILIEDNDGFISEDIDAAFKFGVVDDLLITLEFNPNSFLPCKLFGGESIVKPGTYYLMGGIILLDESGAEIMRVETPGESPVISKNADAVEGEEITAHEITLPFGGEKPQTFEGYIFRKDSGEYVNFADVSNAGIRAITVDYMLAYSLANNEIPPELIGEGIPPRILEIVKKIKPKRRRKATNYTQAGTIKYPNDPVSIAIMQRFAGHFEPADYFSDKGREVKAGEGGTVRVQVQAPVDVEITAPVDSYVLDDTAFFWTTMLFNVARDTGNNEIYGADILKRAGWKNPYKADSAGAMASAARSITKALKTWLAVDTTNERQRKGRKRREVLESFGLRPAISGNIDFTTEAVLDEEGNQTGEIVKDFVVTLNAPDEVAEAFPLFAYALSRNMLLTVGSDEFTFEGLKLTEEHRRMWFYVLRRIKSKGLTNKILFATMWETLALEERGSMKKPVVDENGEPIIDEGGNIVFQPETDADTARKQTDAMRKKKERMIAALEKMLIQASGGLKSGEKMKKGQKPKYKRRIDSWKYTKDKAGRVDGVEVTQLKDE